MVLISSALLDYVRLQLFDFRHEVVWLFCARVWFFFSWKKPCRPPWLSVDGRSICAAFWRKVVARWELEEKMSVYSILPFSNVRISLKWNISFLLSNHMDRPLGIQLREMPKMNQELEILEQFMERPLACVNKVIRTQPTILMGFTIMFISKTLIY